MTCRLLRFFCACGAGGSLLGLLLAVVLRSVLPAGGVMSWVAFGVMAIPLALLWAWFCWWWCMVRS